MRRGVYYLVVALLFAIGIGLMIYQHINFGVPWLPCEKNTAWQIEAKVSFTPSSTDDTAVPVKISFAIPETQPGYRIYSETTASPDYGLAFNDINGHSRAEWTKRAAYGQQVLYYRVGVLADKDATSSMMTTPKIADDIDMTEEPYLTAMRQISTAAYNKSTEAFSYTRELFNELDRQDQNAKLLSGRYSPSKLMVLLLNNKGIPARIVKALKLEDGRRNQHLIPYIAVFNDQNEYKIFNPETRTEADEKNIFIWESYSGSLIDLSGGTDSKVSFSIVKTIANEKTVFSMKKYSKDSNNLNKFDLSINALPIEEQAVFKSILLLPIGVLIVVFLRIIVGIKTSGTFMPVLIATAFLQTNLTVGLIGFLTIVGIGLIIRSWLSYLNLLLVARISTVIIAVIALIGTLSFITYRIGLTDGIKITFFPMIILSWTIERMSVLWEEEGSKEVFVQGGGSIFVAVVAYLAMSNPAVQHITFNFLGLLPIILAIVLLIGNYTGYRLSELKRFRPLAQEIPVDSNGVTEADHLKKETRELKHDKKEL